MPFLIGTDEAGYAPNLGPLVISATVWEVAADWLDDRLYKPLKKVVCNCAAKAHAARVAWADSKALYSPSLGLGVLERGVLAALALCAVNPIDWRALWHALDPAFVRRVGLDAVAHRLQFAAAARGRAGRHRVARAGRERRVGESRSAIAGDL